MPRSRQRILNPPHTAQDAQPSGGLMSIDARTFPLRSADLQATAEGGLAVSRLRQSYENPYDEPLEVLYTLPLPAEGAVIGYTIRIGEKTITGQIESREKAEKKYRKALEEGRLGGLLEQDRTDTFHQSLGNLPARTPVEVEIRVLHPLAFIPALSNGAEASGAEAKGAEAGREGADRPGRAPGRWEYRFPTVSGVRYMGDQARVPDAERLEPGRADKAGTGVALSFDLRIGDGADVAPASPSHRIRVEVASEGAPAEAAPAGTSHSAEMTSRPTTRPAIHVTFDSATPLDRDVRILWTATRDNAEVRFVEGKGLEGDNGRYGLVTITPPTVPGRVTSRDLTILIDASGSMSGFPIETARDLASELIRSLGPSDRFELTAFASNPVDLVKGPLEATPENIAIALKRLAELDTGGATEMDKAVLHALQPLREGSQRQVVILTDGQIGFEQEIVYSILKKLPAGARLHVAGIGQAPNRSLTRDASRAGRGIEVLVAGEADLAAGVDRLLRATAAPVLTELEVSGTAVKAIAPARPRDVFAGQPVVVALELNPAGGTIELRGALANAEPWSRTMEIAAAAPGLSDVLLPLGAFFGHEAIADEEMRLAAAGAEHAPTSRRGRGVERTEVLSSAEILDRIESLGLRHRIPSRRTSLVAVAEEPSADPNAPRRRERLVVEMPAEVSPEGVGFMPAVCFAAPTGRLAAYLTSADVNEVSGRVESPIHRLSISEPRVYSPRVPGVPSPPPPFIAHRGWSGAAHVLSRDADVLVLEFEVPYDGFLLPDDGARVWIAIGTDEVRAFEARGSLFHPAGIPGRIDRSRSTRPQHYPRGIVVRIAFRIGDGSPWPVDVSGIAVEQQHGALIFRRVGETDEWSVTQS